MEVCFISAAVRATESKFWMTSLDYVQRMLSQGQIVTNVAMSQVNGVLTRCESHFQAIMAVMTT